MLSSRGFALLVALGATGPFFACGARTGLFASDDVLILDPDAGDALVRPRDALPPLDVALRDANRNDCPDAATTFVYLVTNSSELLSFNPPTGELRTRGRLSCPTRDPGDTPFSMAVDRRGGAWVVYSSGELFRVSTLTAACQSTSFATGQGGFPEQFGMGFASDEGGPQETLFLAGDDSVGGASELASLDQSLRLRRVGTLSPIVRRAELTGTGGGDLFAFYASPTGDNESFIGQVDKRTGAIFGQARLPLAQGRGWAFAFWGGDFWLFTGPNGQTTISRYRPTDGSLGEVGRLSTLVVGAGVSTCAPQQ